MITLTFENFTLAKRKAHLITLGKQICVCFVKKGAVYIYSVIKDKKNYKVHFTLIGFYQLESSKNLTEKSYINSYKNNCNENVVLFFGKQHLYLYNLNKNKWTKCEWSQSTRTPKYGDFIDNNKQYMWLLYTTTPRSDSHASRIANIMIFGTLVHLQLPLYNRSLI